MTFPIPPLPYDLANGTPADANQVMADFDLLWTYLNDLYDPGAGNAKFLAQFSADVSCVNGLWTLQYPDVESIDVGGYYDPITGLWTPPAGKVVVGTFCQLTTNVRASQVACAAILKNTAFWKPSAPKYSVVNGDNFSYGLFEDEATGSDVYQMETFASTAGSNYLLDAKDSSSPFPYLSGFFGFKLS